MTQERDCKSLLFVWIWPKSDNVLLQDLPMNKAALEYVLETARQDDINITQEQGCNSLGALGLTGQMALARIGEHHHFCCCLVLFAYQLP